MSNPDQLELNLGPQPLDEIMNSLDLCNHDLVAASTEQLSHKMVTRARKGRRLKRKPQEKILRALNTHIKGQSPDTHRIYALPDLFNYKGLF
ncbi:MAG: hypothetical protein ACI9UA_003264 [Pseudoalteromonas tetraodonis]|jgi:hypothetical protein